MEKKEKTETVKPTNIYEAILLVMEEVEKIEKSMTVGAGVNSYKAVSDEMVKLAIRQSMIKNGLVLIPKTIQESTEVNNFVDQYGKQKMNVFTKVNTTYSLVFAPTKEEIEIPGYGHSVDNQDKGAGKATTYALKYAMLYTFLIATGKLDDTDKTHSNEIAPEPIQQPVKQQKTECDAKTFETIKQAIIDGKRTIEQAKEKFIFTGTQNIELLNLKK